MIKGVKFLKNIDFIVKAWKLESITNLNRLCSACKKCSIFSNLDDGVIQCIRDFNGVLDGVDVLEGFTMDELRDFLNMVYVTWYNTMLWKVSVIHCEIPHSSVLHNILTLNLTI